MRRRFLSKTHVIATILVILDISCMFVTMETDSARNLVCWALGFSIAAMWCQFGPLSDFLSLCLSPSACVSVFFVFVFPQPVSGPLCFFFQKAAVPASLGDTHRDSALLCPSQAFAQSPLTVLD